MRQSHLFYDRALIVDNFAGGGGASTALERALGRHVDLAVNHDPEALACHAANHPKTLHLCGDVWSVDPRAVCRGQKVAVLWASPACTHFSRVRVQAGELCPQTRSLADVVVVWAREVRPDVIFCENVIEWASWGPLYPTTPDVPKHLRGRPIKERAGEEFRRWCADLRAAGYALEHRALKAHHYGAPTSRERLFVVARCDGLPIVWPEPTHGPGLLPYRTARECIDWSVPCRSIFGRSRPLSEAAQRRIARGLVKFGHESIATIGYGERKGQAPRVMSLDAPLTTIVAGGVKHALVTAFVAKTDGGHEGYGHGLNSTIHTACQDNHAIVAVTLALPSVPDRSDRCRSLTHPRRRHRGAGGWDSVEAAEPECHATARAEEAGDKIGEARLHDGPSQRGVEGVPDVRSPSCVASVARPDSEGTRRQPHGRRQDQQPPEQPGTRDAGGEPSPRVPYWSQEGDQPPTRDIRSCCADARGGPVVCRHRETARRVTDHRLSGMPNQVTALLAKDRRAECRAWLDAYVGPGAFPEVEDIGMRPLTPRELFTCQGFSPTYQINPTIGGRGLSVTAQVRLVGNSVSPPVAEALVRANCGQARGRRVA